MIRYLAVASAMVGAANTVLLAYPGGVIPTGVLVGVAVTAAALAAGSAVLSSNVGSVQAHLATLMSRHPS